MDPNRDELDEIIDRGLTAYSSRDPLAGLEDRVLNRIHLADAGRRQGLGWRWALVVPALAAMVTVVVVSRSNRVPIAKPTQTAHVNVTPPVTPVPPPAPAIVPSHPIRRSHAARVLPKLDRFPTPTPLSPEERALVALAQLRPADVEAFAELRKKNSQEIQIPPIEIPPLRIDGNQ